MTAQPWWAPDNWLMVLLGVIAGHILAEAWARHCQYVHRRTPRRYVRALMSMLVTSSLLTLLGWLDDQPIKAAIYDGIMWGGASPIVWMCITEMAIKYSPRLAGRLGYDRREDRQGGGEWSEQRRETYRCGLFEDTAKIAVKDITREKDDS